MTIIAPLGYERYAALVNPLPVPDIAHVDAKPPSGAVAELGRVNTALNRSGARAGEGLKSPDSRPAHVRRNPSDGDSAFSASPLRPTDINLGFLFSSTARRPVQDPPAIDSRTVLALYDHSETPRGVAVRISG